jgi:hypothetical protein
VDEQKMWTQPAGRLVAWATVRYRPIVLKMSSGNYFGMSQISKQSVIVQ